jgi:hypothetical protein
MTIFSRYKTELVRMIMVLVIPFLINGCVVNKPDAGRVSYRDYNGRKVVSDVHYHKKLSPIGISVSIGSAAVGGFAGYNMNMITRQDGETRTAIRPANAFIGALIGFSVCNLVNYSFGLNKREGTSDYQKWLKKANKNMLFARNEGTSEFVAIDKNAEFQYIVKNIQDVRDFRTAFPYSSNSGEVIKKSVPAVSRYELLEIISLYPDNPSTMDAKTEYIKKSPSLNELISAREKFPETNFDIEPLAASLVTNLTEAKTYASLFPTGSRHTEVEVNAIRFIKDIHDVELFKSIYPESPYVKDVFTIALKLIPREDIPELIKMFPGLTAEVQTARQLYLTKSNNLAEVLQTNSISKGNSKDVEKASLSFIHNYNDAVTFKNAYPATEYQSEVQLAAVDNSSFTETASLIKMFPATSATQTLKEKYIQKCRDIDDCITAKNTFPDLTDKARERASELTDELAEMKQFKSNFPNATPEQVTRIFSECIRSDGNTSDIPGMVTLYPSNSVAGEAKEKYISHCESPSDLRNALTYFPDKKSTIISSVKGKLNAASSTIACKQIGDAFPEFANEAETKAFTMLRSIEDYNSFMNIYPNSKYRGELNSKVAQWNAEQFKSYCRQAENNMLSGDFDYAYSNINQAKQYSSGSKDDVDRLDKLQDRYVSGKGVEDTKHAKCGKDYFIGAKVYRCYIGKGWLNKGRKYMFVGDIISFNGDMIFVKVPYDRYNSDDFEVDGVKHSPGGEPFWTKCSGWYTSPCNN